MAYLDHLFLVPHGTRQPENLTLEALAPDGLCLKCHVCGFSFADSKGSECEKPPKSH